MSMPACAHVLNKLRIAQERSVPSQEHNNMLRCRERDTYKPTVLATIPT